MMSPNTPADTYDHGPRNHRQASIGQWVVRCFGYATMTSLAERAARVVEEALELAQAAGVQQVTVERIADYVFSRPPGDVGQEAGGVGITLLAFCEAARFSADQAEAAEAHRVMTLPPEHFEARQKIKAQLGLTPGVGRLEHINRQRASPAREALLQYAFDRMAARCKVNCGDDVNIPCECQALRQQCGVP